ncbi:hypothetical protein Hamer_G009549 [Homarus americanus]|uniref:Uncharacterized protein n=1 Tax=Homarus americanus TaxID=6706 RepID=A0A8J5TH59_HOMAM|nr:hypothetical protein Hamer_G009549 [Homarus americanus]
MLVIKEKAIIQPSGIFTTGSCASHLSVCILYIFSVQYNDSFLVFLHIKLRDTFIVDIKDKYYSVGVNDRYGVSTWQPFFGLVLIL